MKHRKQLLASLLAVAMLCTILPAPAMATEMGNGGETITEEDTAKLEESSEEQASEISDDELEVVTEEEPETSEKQEEQGSALEYLYLGEQVVNIYDTQEVIAAIADPDRVLLDGAIWFTVGEETEEQSRSVERIADNGMLFLIGGLTDQENGTTVTLNRITYTYQTEDSDEIREEEILLNAEEIRARYTITTEEVLEATVTENTPDLDESLVLTDEEIDEEVAAEGGEAEETEGIATSIEDSTSVYVLNEDGEEPEQADSIEEALSLAEEQAANANGNLIIALDPGHDSTHLGASYYGVDEYKVNLAVALACKKELETYSGVTVYMTRSTDECPNPTLGTSGKDNIARIQKAVEAGANVYVSIHMNAAENKNANGAEVYIPNASYRKDLYQEGNELGNKILKQLEALGLKNRGVVVRNATDGTRYADGNIADYYTVNYECKKRGITGIIIEHGFLSNEQDRNYLNSTAGQNELGVADATAIAQQYGLTKANLAAGTTRYQVQYQGHVQSIGWNTVVTDGMSAGTSGRALRMEALKIKVLQTKADKNGRTTTTELEGAISYRAHVQSYGWMDWVTDGAMAGTSGEAKRVEALQIRLTGDIAKEYDIYYRVHSQSVGWLGWAKNGQKAGTADLALRMEDVQIKLVKKGEAAPGSMAMPFYSSTSRGNVTYQTHVQSYGWMDLMADGASSGTEGEAKRVEALKIWLTNPTDPSTGKEYTGDIVYRTHVQSYGWLPWVKNGEEAGTTGEAKRVESLQIQLTGELAQKYDIYYRAHSQTYGWLGWAKNGETAGTAGLAKRVEALQVMLVDKEDTATISRLDAQGTNSYRISEENMYLKIQDLTGKGSSFKLAAYNTHSAGAFDHVEFDVWSTANGKDDKKTYQGSSAAEGTWTATVQTANHSGMGEYQTQVFGVRADGTRVLILDGSFVAKEKSVTPITVTAGNVMSGTQIYRYLLNAGLTPAGAAGLMGNIRAESGWSQASDRFYPTNLQNTFNNSLGYTDQEYTDAVDSGVYDNFVNDKAGYGLVQWTYWSRKEGLLNFRNASGTSIGNCQMQVNYILKELKTSYPTLYKTLTTTDSYEEASKDVLQIYERPATYKEASTIALRESFAKAMYETYAK